jgi:hypothetical protein
MVEGRAGARQGRHFDGRQYPLGRDFHLEAGIDESHVLGMEDA